MAAFPPYAQTVERVFSSATLVAATPQTTSYVDVRGARAVHFIVRSTTAGETDAFTEPDLSVKVAADAGAALSVTSPGASNAAGVLTANAAACVTAANQGYVLTVYPEGVGTEAGYPNSQRFGCDSIALILGPHATNDISTVVVDAVVVWG